MYTKTTNDAVEKLHYETGFHNGVFLQRRQQCNHDYIREKVNLSMDYWAYKQARQVGLNET